jgi:hypothetical protein
MVFGKVTKRNVRILLVIAHHVVRVVLMEIVQCNTHQRVIAMPQVVNGIHKQQVVLMICVLQQVRVVKGTVSMDLVAQMI